MKVSSRSGLRTRIVLPDVRISCLPRREVSIRESVSLVIFSSAATIRLGVFKLDLEWDAFMRNRALSQQPMNAARFRILESEIIEKRDDITQMLAHRRKHSQCKLRPFAQ